MSGVFREPLGLPPLRPSCGRALLLYVIRKPDRGRGPEWSVETEPVWAGKDRWYVKRDRRWVLVPFFKEGPGPWPEAIELPSGEIIWSLDWWPDRSAWLRSIGCDPATTAVRERPVDQPAKKK